jgi:hypothetical protein
MTINTITSIQPTGSFDCKAGPQAGKTLYSFAVTFANGVTGHANAVNPKPAWAEGDAVGYDITGQDTRGGNRLKINRKAAQGAPMATTPAIPVQNPGNAVQSTQEVPSNPHTQQMINGQTVGMCINNAVSVLKELFIDGSLKVSDGTFAIAVHDLASQLIRISYKLEHGKLASKVGEAVPETTKAALAASGWSAPQSREPANGSAYHESSNGDDEDVPF